MKMTNSNFPDFRRFKRLGAAALLALSASFVVTACEDQPVSVNEYLQRAEEYRSKGDYAASNIELKNALRIDPENQDARYLAGANYYDLGAWSFAEVTLEKAMKDKGVLEYAILPVLARAKLALGKFSEAYDLAQTRPNMNAELTAEMNLLRGQALVGKRKPEDARKAFDAALESNPNSAEAYIGLAGLAVKDREDAKADELLAKAVELAPDALTTLRFQGQYYFFRKDFEKAEKAFDAVVKKWPNRHEFVLDLAEVQIARGKYKDAIGRLDPILKRAPKYARANYLRALTAYHMKDYATAATYSQNVQAITQRHGPSTLILGVSSYINGQHEQAVRALETYLAIDPSSTVARKILGAAQLQLNRAKAAVATLEPAAKELPDDEALLWMLGHAAGRSGDLEKSSSYFEKIVELRPEDSRARATLGAARIALGNYEAGIEELEKAVQSNSKIPQADMTLIISLLRAKRYDDALAAAERLQKTHPNQPYGYSAAGAALVGKGDMQKAKAVYETALKVEPGTPDAATNLATLEMRAGNMRKARALLQEVLEHHPGHYRTLDILGALEAEQKNPAEAVKWLEQAIKLRPNALRPNLLMAQLLLAGGSHEKALLILQRLAPRYPDDVGVLEAMGKAHMLGGQPDLAHNVFESLTRIDAGSAEAKYLLATALHAKARWDDAQMALEDALALDPMHVNARLALADLHLLRNRPDAAGEIIDRLAQDRGNDSRTMMLRGRLAEAQGRTQEAIDWYTKVDNAGSGTEVILSLSRAQARSGKIKAAVATLESWLKTQPRDANVRFQLAGLHLLMNEPGKARPHFQKLVELEPRNWLFHNNLAGTLHILEEDVLALDAIERAYRIAPQQAVVLDTYATILLKKGNHERAVQMLRRAVERSPDSKEIAFNLASALTRSGQKDEAASILRQLLSDGENFRIRKSAEALLQKLGG